MITIKRIYEPKSKEDGYRVLVDRLWPRGVSKDEAHIDLWLKEIAPSNELRRWYGHEVNKWNEFQKKYRAELEKKTELVNQIQTLKKEHKKITFLFAAKDVEHNNAVVLSQFFT
jgi:uncharacterized protein YeaO (DUF488 family)